MPSHAIQDRLEDAVSSLRQLSTRAELLQPELQPEPASSAEPGAATAQRRVWRAEGELQELMLGPRCVRWAVGGGLGWLG